NGTSSPPAATTIISTKETQPHHRVQPPQRLSPRLRIGATPSPHVTPSSPSSFCATTNSCPSKTRRRPEVPTCCSRRPPPTTALAHASSSSARGPALLARRDASLCRLADCTAATQFRHEDVTCNSARFGYRAVSRGAGVGPVIVSGVE
ncbi:hypothetical protein Tsubulata_009271, partial [Turnera subulata]